MNDQRAAIAIDIGPVYEAAINCGFYFLIFLAAVALDRVFPERRALSYVLVTLPYLIVIGFILIRRSLGAPRFVLGNAGEPLFRYVLVWAALLLIALMFAVSNGLLRLTAMTGVGALRTLGAIVGAPLAEELVFRGALLTSLQRTVVGKISLSWVPLSAIVGAVIYAAMHCAVYLVAGFSASDALLSSGTALILGAAFGVIYLKTQNIWYGVLVHALINLGQWN
jgi:membrane protease YdiL (CAAX protease family)